MAMAPNIILVPFVFSAVAQSFRIVPSNFTESGLLEVEASSLETHAALKCPSRGQTTKDYYFDIPIYGDKLQSVALHLLRDPADPQIRIYRNAIWTVVQDIDSRRRPLGTHEMIPVSRDGTRAKGATYSMDDIEQLRRGIDHLELITTTCDTLAPPASIRPETASASFRGSARGSLRRSQSKSIRGSARGSWRRSQSKGKSKGRVSHRLRRGSRYNRGSRTISLGSNRSRPWTSSYLEIKGPDEKCSMKLAGGTYYQTKAVKQALTKRMRRSTGSRLKIEASDISQFKSVSPSLASVVLPILAGTTGFVAPPVFLPREMVAAAATLGTLIPAAILTTWSISKRQRLNRMSGTEVLFEKLYCLSKRKTCGGQPCFKVCKDPEKNKVLVPFSKDQEGMLRC